MTVSAAAPFLSRRARADSSPNGQQGIACSRREAADAARAVLEQGGNAVDAAVAALLVLYVIDPVNTGLGGYGGSLVVHSANSGRVGAIDCTSRAPRTFDVARFNAKSAEHGYLAVSVPGNVAGIDAALRTYGSMPFKELACRAIELAEGGVTVTPALAQQFAKLVKDIDPASMKAYFPGSVPAEGAPWVQRDLARLMRRLGDEGPGSFYHGEIAAQICRQVRANGGALAEDDFHAFAATTNEPLHINYRGFDLYTPTLPSGGLTCLSILKTLEQFDFSKLAPWGAEYYDLYVNAATLAWGERRKYFGDPEFVEVPIEKLLSVENARANAAMIRVPQAPAKADASHTVNVVVADKQGNVVSWTSTHGNDFGSHVAIDGLGLMLGHGISRFDVDPANPNFPAGGKRPQHNMAPLVVMRGGKPVAGLGLPGGPKIVSVTTQMAVSLIDFRGSAEQVVSAPRIHTEGHEPVIVSTSTPAAVTERLEKAGHKVERVGSVGGIANAITMEAGSGRMQAAVSPAGNGALVF